MLFARSELFVWRRAYPVHIDAVIYVYGRILAVRLFVHRVPGTHPEICGERGFETVELKAGGVDCGGVNAVVSSEWKSLASGR